MCFQSGLGIFQSSNAIHLWIPNPCGTPKLVVTLTLSESIELEHNSASLGYYWDWILYLQSIAVNYHHLQAKQLQSSPHKDCEKLEKKVPDNPASDQQSSHPCRILCKYCHPQQIDLLKPKQTALLVRTHPKAKPLPQLGGVMHPSQYANSSTIANKTYDILLLNLHLIASPNT
jgi:hypothetical protein